MQRVDPFIPVSPRRSIPLQQSKISTPAIDRQPKSVDGVIRQRKSSPSPRPVVSQPIRAVESSIVLPTPLVGKPRPKRLRITLRNVGTIVAILAAGVGAQTLVLGEALVVLYAVYAIVRRVASRTTFMLVLVSLATIMLLHVFGRGVGLAANFAVYSLLLAFVGIVSLAREVRQAGK